MSRFAPPERGRLADRSVVNFLEIDVPSSNLAGTISQQTSSANTRPHFPTSAAHYHRHTFDLDADRRLLPAIAIHRRKPLSLPAQSVTPAVRVAHFRRSGRGSHWKPMRILVESPKRMVPHSCSSICNVHKPFLDDLVCSGDHPLISGRCSVRAR